MEDMKKRKLGESAAEGDGVSSAEELRTLLEPLAKPQLVDLLAKLYFFRPNSLSLSLSVLLISFSLWILDCFGFCSLLL